MKRPPYLQIIPIVGFILMALGFAGYVTDPEYSYESLFILGLIMLIIPYGILVFSSKKASEKLADIQEKESMDGFVYYMDGEPSGNDASITDLTKR